MKKIIIISILYLLFNVIENVQAQSVNQQKYQLGLSYEKNGMNEEAERIFDELIKAEPNNKNFFDAYVVIMKRQNKFSQLEVIAENYYNKNKNAETANLMAELYWRSGKLDKANDLWDESINYDKSSKDLYTLISNTQIDLRLFDKAISTLLLGRENLDDSFIFSDQLIKLYISTNNYKSGFKEILNSLNNNMDLATAQGRIYALMSNQESIDFLNNGLKDLANQNKQALAYQELYAWFLRTTERLDEALDIYVRLDELKKTNGYEIMNFATMSTKDGNYDIALKAYDLLMAKGRNNPYYSSAVYGYTKVLDDKIANNEENIDAKLYSEIIDRYNKIITEYPKTGQAADSRLRIAMIYGDKLNDIDNAIKELYSLREEFPNTIQFVNGSLRLGKYLLMEGKPDKAITIFKEVLNNKRIVSPNQTDEAEYNLALCEYYTGSIEEAKKNFKVISKDTESNSSNDALTILTFLEENKTFVEPLNTYIAAEYKKYQRKYNDAFDLYLETESKAENSSLGELALFNAAMIKFENKDYSKFRDIINNLLTKYPNSLRGDEIIYYLAGSFYNEKNEAEALKNYTELLTKYPNSIYLNDARKKIRILRKEKL
ncbi:MAG TPA: tetratricopeptide repeat protein [Candidatus Kapabacteria bacterium]|nr:tetratricopeptide repeat protein [Candidatus Kapabacteria bacterium]